LSPRISTTTIVMLLLITMLSFFLRESTNISHLHFRKKKGIAETLHLSTKQTYNYYTHIINLVNPSPLVKTQKLQYNQYGEGSRLLRI
jgi:hypothetical protein